MLQDKRIVGAIYPRAPEIIQNFMFSMHGLLKLNQHKYIQKMHLAPLLESQYDFKKLENIQNKKFIKLLKHCSQTVPFYKRYFNNNDFSLDAFSGIESINQLPIITKEQILKNYSDLMSLDYRKYNPTKRETGGSTGTSLITFCDAETTLCREAELLRYYNWHGYNPFSHRTVVLRGNVLFSRFMKEGSLIRKDSPRNILYLSSYYVNEESLKHYVDKIKAFKPHFLRAYPSSAYILAKFVNENGFSLKLDGVFTTSETLYDSFRDEIQKAFSCRVYDHYGHSEPGCYAAGQCKYGNYHISSENVFVEVSNDGYIIETSLNNFSMPFIRYKTGDKCDDLHYGCECGIQLPFFKKIYGREDDMLISHGKIIAPGGLNQIFKGVNVKMGQIIQTREKHIIVKLVPTPQFTSKNAIQINKALIERVGKEFVIEIRKVKEIPLTPSGKYRLVVRNIKSGPERQIIN